MPFNDYLEEVLLNRAMSLSEAEAYNMTLFWVSPNVSLWWDLVMLGRHTCCVCFTVWAKMATGSELDRVRISAAELRAEASSSVNSKDSQKGNGWLDGYFIGMCTWKNACRSREASRATPLEAEQSCQVCALLMLLASELHQRYLSLLWSRALL